MAVVLRLMRLGKRKNPSYRIIAVDKRKKRDGKYIEKVGHYNPLAEPNILEINKERVEYWLKNGAVPSTTVKALIKKAAKLT